MELESGVESGVCCRVRRVWAAEIIGSLAVLHGFFESANRIRSSFNSFPSHLFQVVIVDNFVAKHVRRTFLLSDMFVHLGQVGFSFTNMIHPIVPRLLKIPANKFVSDHVAKLLELFCNGILAWS